MVVNYGSDHISNWTCYVYNLASNSLDHVSNWKCVVLKSGHNFGQMSFFSGTLIRTDVAFGQMSLSDRSRVTRLYGALIHAYSIHKSTLIRIVNLRLFDARLYKASIITCTNVKSCQRIQRILGFKSCYFA